MSGITEMFKTFRSPVKEEVLDEEPSSEEEEELVEASTEEAEETSTEEKVEEASEPDLREEVRALRAELEMSRAAAKRKPTEEASVPEIESRSFLTEEYRASLEDVFSSEQLDVLDTLLGEVYRQGREDTRNDLPHFVQPIVSQQGAVNRTIEEFYTRNPDMRDLTGPQQEYLQDVANGFEAENPDMSSREVLDLAAKRVREVLGLPEQKASEAKASKDSKKSRTNFAKSQSKGSRTQHVEDESGDPQAAGVAEMLNFAQRR